MGNSCPDRGGRRTQARLTDAFAKAEGVSPGRQARRLVVDVLTPEQLAALGDVARVIVAAVPEVVGQDVIHC